MTAVGGVPAPGGNLDSALWLTSVLGWTLAGVLFFIPSFYWIAVHGFAVVGFLSVITGKARTIIPPIEAAREAMIAFATKHATRPP
jgi:hypothetical protein